MARYLSTGITSVCFLVAFTGALTVASTAAANPRALPFTYPYETLPEGEFEIEQYADLIPLRAQSSSGANQWYLGSQLQTEFEYGISNRLELGLYVTWVPGVGEGQGLTNTATLTEGNGVKQRLRLRLAEEGQWPIDVALYGEVSENEREVEFEGKIILQKRFGHLTAIANLWAEREYYYVAHQHDWVLNPTAGLTYEVTPMFHPGIEGWMRAEFPDISPGSPRPFNLLPHPYVGPAMMFNFGRLWWSTGVYVRLDDAFRSMQPGDAYGNIWIRTVVGIGL